MCDEMHERANAVDSPPIRRNQARPPVHLQLRAVPVQERLKMSTPKKVARSFEAGPCIIFSFPDSVSRSQ